jgi:hypothetical protein
VLGVAESPRRINGVPRLPRSRWLRARSWRPRVVWRRWACGLGAVGIAGALVLGSGVEQSAYALSIPDPLTLLGDTPAAPVLEDAGAAGLDAGGVVACTASVVCLGAVSAIAVGAGLYATRNTWLPWVKNLLGPGTSVNSVPNPAANSYIVLALNGSAVVGGSVVVTATNTNNQYGEGANFSINIICATNGVDSVQTVSNEGMSVQAGGTGSFTTGCGSGSIPVYAWTGPPTPAGGIAPLNYPTWGSPNFSDSVITYTTTVTCVTASGSTVQLSVTTPGGNNGVILPSCSAAGLGNYGKSVTVTPSVGGKSIGNSVSTTLPSQQAYPACDPGSGNVCYFRVKVYGQPCNVGDARCVTWYQTWLAAPTQVECDWGPYVVPTAMCSFLKNAYAPSGSDTNTNPITSPVTQPTANPTPAPTVTVTAPPDAGGNSSPVSAPNPTVPTTNSGECFPQGWAAFNPVEWVLKPVECALVWAFEPDQATLTDTQTQLNTDLSASGVGPLFGAVGGLLGQLGGGGGGCDGPAVDFSIGSVQQTLHPWSACAEPMATVAGMVYALSSVLIVVFGALSFVRAVGSGFGWSFSMGKAAPDGD